MRFPRLYAAASLKHRVRGVAVLGSHSFPRLYAAASLKHPDAAPLVDVVEEFSAALCRGLIEAAGIGYMWAKSAVVFRGFMPRPH